MGPPDFEKEQRQSADTGGLTRIPHKYLKLISDGERVRTQLKAELRTSLSRFGAAPGTNLSLPDVFPILQRFAERRFEISARHFLSVLKPAEEKSVLSEHPKPARHDHLKTGQA